MIKLMAVVVAVLPAAVGLAGGARLDISDETARQTVIAEGGRTLPDGYQGHPTTVLTREGKHGVWPGNEWDTGYSGVEKLADGTILCTTYTKHFDDDRYSSVVATRLYPSDFATTPAELEPLAHEADVFGGLPASVVCRLRLWPDLAPGETNDVRAAAAKRGMFLTMHHIEPLGTSGFMFKDYWKKRDRTMPYSYFSHPKEVEEASFAVRWKIA